MSTLRLKVLRQHHLLRTSRLPSRIPSSPLRRPYATEPPAPHPPSTPPNPNNKPPSRVGAYYKTFSYPVLKAFLAALFTYQLAYYAWTKLEAVEDKFDKQNEISGLKRELSEAVAESRDRAKGVVDKVGEKVEQGKKRGWWPW